MRIDLARPPAGRPVAADHAAGSPPLGSRRRLAAYRPPPPVGGGRTRPLPSIRAARATWKAVALSHKGLHSEGHFWSFLQPVTREYVRLRQRYAPQPDPLRQHAAARDPTFRRSSPTCRATDLACAGHAVTEKLVRIHGLLPLSNGHLLRCYTNSIARSHTRLPYHALSDLAPNPAKRARRRHYQRMVAPPGGKTSGPASAGPPFPDGRWQRGRSREWAAPFKLLVQLESDAVRSPHPPPIGRERSATARDPEPARASGFRLAFSHVPALVPALRAPPCRPLHARTPPPTLPALARPHLPHTQPPAAIPRRGSGRVSSLMIASEPELRFRSRWNHQ